MKPEIAADREFLHLAIVVNFISPGGGVATAARGQAAALAEYFDVTVIAGEGQLDHKQVQVVNYSAPKFHWLRRFSHVVREYWFCVAARRDLQQLHQYKPIDFVIFHSHTGVAIAGVQFRKSTGTRFAAMTHGDIFSRPAGAYDPLLTRLYRWATAKSYRQSDLIIALSPFMREAAINNGAKPSAVKLIPNGLAVAALGEKALKQLIDNRSAGSALRLLFVGRLALEKGVDTLLNGFALAVKENDQLRLTIVGDGPLQKQCIEMSQQLGIDQSVTFAGQLQRSRVVELYQSHDVFCITSISDPLPTVVLEAMHFGLPVIGTDIDGIPFMVEAGETGCLIPPGAAENFAEAVKLLSSQPALRAKMGQCGHARVQSEFAWEVIGAQLESVIRKLICSSPK